MEAGAATAGSDRVRITVEPRSESCADRFRSKPFLFLCTLCLCTFRAASRCLSYLFARKGRAKTTPSRRGSLVIRRVSGGFRRFDEESIVVSARRVVELENISRTELDAHTPNAAGREEDGLPRDWSKGPHGGLH